MKTPTEKQIKNAKDVLKRAGYIPYYWHISDIKGRDEANSDDETSDLEEWELLQIAESVADNADANYGICWETFDSEIETQKEARKNAK